MDLLLLAQDVTWGGRTGDSIHLRELVRHLVLRGHAARVIVRASPDGGAVAADFDVRPLASSWNLAFSAVRKPAVVRALLREVRRRRPDVLYSRGFGDFGEALAMATTGIPLVFEVNGDAIAERETQRDRPMPIAVRALVVQSVRVAFRRARSIVAVTETLRRRLVEDFGVPSEKILVVPNAANTDLFFPRPTAEARAALGLPKEASVIGFVGNLAPWQGVDSLIRAFARLSSRRPAAVLLIVGGGQARPLLESLSRELGVRERVRFAGPVPYDRVPIYVAAMDICTAPMTRERLKSGSSAIKIHEYLACERPVVASQIPGLEFLESEDIGRLVPPEDGRALEAALDEALTHDVWRREAGARGRAYVLRCAGWPAVAAAIEDVCRRAVGR